MSWLAPWPVVVQALVLGCGQAVIAVGLVLIYRTSRTVNLAHAETGIAGAVLAVLAINVWDWWWWAALLLGVAAAGAVGLLVELVFVRRFHGSPAVLLVVTAALAQLLVAAGVLLPIAVAPEVSAGAGTAADGDGGSLASSVALAPPTTPFSGSTWDWGPVRFTGDHVALAVLSVVLLLAIGWMLQRTRVGLSIRAGAEDRARAELLGVRARSASSIVWVVAAASATVATVLAAPVQGVAQSLGRLDGGVAASVGTDALLVALAAALAGRWRDLRVTAAAALGIAVLRTVVLWGTGRPDFALGAVALLVLVLLAVQHRRPLTGRDVAVTDDLAALRATWPPVPAVMRGLAEVAAARSRTTAAVVGVLVAIPLLLRPSQVGVVAGYAGIAIVVISLVVVAGWGGQLSLGQFALAGVGALVAGLAAEAGVPFLVALVAGALAGAAAAVPIGLVALRSRGLGLPIGTLALAVVFGSVVLSERNAGWLPAIVTRPQWLGVDFDDPLAWYVLNVVVVAAVVGSVAWFRRSRQGAALLAARDNPASAAAFGVDVDRVRAVAFVVAGGIAGLGGGLLVSHQQGLQAATFDAGASIAILLIAVIGGLGSVAGALAATAWFAAIDTFLTGPGAQLLASGVVVLFLISYFPAGIAGAMGVARAAWLRRLARRLGLRVPVLGVAPGEAGPAPLAPATAEVDRLCPADHRQRISATSLRESQATRIVGAQR